MVLVIGIGNLDRGDDAAGVLVARRVRALAIRRDVRVTELIGDQLELLDTWIGAQTVYVIDAVRSGGPAGTVYRFDEGQSVAVRFRHRGTHAISLADVIELARALGRLPDRLVGFGIEGASFEPGAPLSPVVADAVETVTNLIRDELKAGV